MYEESLPENLLDELTRLVGRPVPVVQEALTRLLGILLTESGSESIIQLSPYPMTAWAALAPGCRLSRESWAAVMSVGLSAEEGFTALAVVDDHVRRFYGNDAWKSLRDWGHRLALRYDISLPGKRPVKTVAGCVRGARTRQVM